jgi:hypothetical protein
MAENKKKTGNKKGKRSISGRRNKKTGSRKKNVRKTGVEKGRQ